MSRPQRSLTEIDPGPVQIHARKVQFDVSDVPLHWIPGHPVASNVISLLNLILPAAERWFVATYNEALPLVKDAKLAEDMRGFIGQEGAHAEVHDRLLRDFMEERGIDPTPMVQQMEYVFTKVLAPSTSDDPKIRMNHLCDRLWFIAAIEHYTAVMGDFALNCTWDYAGADPTMADVFRWHGSEEVEHRSVAHDVAVYFHDSYIDRIGAMVMAMIGIFSFFQRGATFLMKADPNVNMGWWRTQRIRMRDSKLGLLPTYSKLFGSNTLMYFKPGFTPDQMGSTAQAVAYLARSPAARAAHM